MDNYGVKKKMEELAKRAKQRRIVLSSTKDDADVKEENKHFEELKSDLYKNIVRSCYK